MGLPQLTFELKKAADTAAARATQGIAGMIPRDTRALGVHVIYQEGDIPAELGADSTADIKRLLHETSPETARPFVPVQGAHDMYRTGESMIYMDGQTYRCLSDTDFSPKESRAAWEVAA